MTERFEALPSDVAFRAFLMGLRIDQVLKESPRASSWPTQRVKRHLYQLETERLRHALQTVGRPSESSSSLEGNK